MSEKEEQQVIKTIAAALPKMTEFQRGYLIGTAEAMAEKCKVGEKDKELAVK